MEVLRTKSVEQSIGEAPQPPAEREPQMATTAGRQSRWLLAVDHGRRMAGRRRGSGGRDGMAGD